MVKIPVNLFPDTNLIDRLLEEQKQLQTPVARYADAHDAGNLRTDLFKHLIPLDKPQKGEQYAFQVELDKCTGCKACVVACHTLNGLDEDEAWRDVGLLEGGDDEPGFQQTVTTACHHCLDPECLNGCPVGAYEKDEESGIVRHLDDQCIGCEYCILKCPYDVPKYSHKRGIVRKCDMCHQRLEVGEAPACVQACPTEAISIIKIDTAALRAKNNFLPGAPPPEVTQPTTRYVGRDVPTAAQPADRERLVAQTPHTPLALMLTLTQAGLGILAGSLFQNSLAWVIAGFLLFNTGMAAATLHLGKPLKAWRFFLGLKTSWLSREILAFSLIAPLPAILLGLAIFPDFPPIVPEIVTTLIKLSLIPAALAAVFTSVMIYVDTKRPTWNLKSTAAQFYGTFLAFALLPLSPWLFALGGCVLLAIEAGLLLPGRKSEWSPAQHQARLRLVPLRRVSEFRIGSLALAMVCAIMSPWLAFPVILFSELLSRHLFFRSVYAPKMPGGPATHGAHLN